MSGHGAAGRPLPSPPLVGSASPPAAVALCAEVLSLPIHAYLTDAEVERVCAALARA